MIKSFETGNTLKEFASYKKQDTRSIVTVLSEYDITRLPSGNYRMVIEARDKQNEPACLQRYLLPAL